MQYATTLSRTGIRVSVPILVAGVATIVAAILRLAFLDSQPLWYDERLQVAAASAPSLPELLLRVVSHSAAAPVDYLGTRIALELGEPRLWAAAVGTATVPVLFLAGRRWYGAGVGAVAAVLLALAPFHVYYSGEARYYALSALVAVLALWTYRIGVDDGRWTPFGVATALCLWSFYFAALVPVALVAILRRGGAYQLLLATVSFLPWVLLAAPSQLAQEYPQAAGLSTVPTPALLAELVVPDVAASGLPVVVPALVVAIVVGLVGLGARRGYVLLAIAAVAVVVTGLATWRAGYFWSPRQVVFVLPLVLLVAAVGLSRIPTRAAGVVLVGLVALSIPFVDGVTGADAWQPRTEELAP